jgi:hypothetical protein
MPRRMLHNLEEIEKEQYLLEKRTKMGIMFNGEPRWVPYFWDQKEAEQADYTGINSEGDTEYYFIVVEYDRQLLPELALGTIVKVWFDSEAEQVTGQVHERPST